MNNGEFTKLQQSMGLNHSPSGHSIIQNFASVQSYNVRVDAHVLSVWFDAAGGQPLAAMPAQ